MDWFPAAGFKKADGGGTSVVLGRSPVLVMSRPGGWVPETPELADEGAADEAFAEAPEPASGDGGGCAAGHAAGGPSGPPWFLVVLPLLWLALRPRKA